MNNIPEIKIGIIASTTDWLPSEFAVKNLKKLVEIYTNKYGSSGIYECSVCITDNEINIKRAMREISKAECDAVCIYYANYGAESAGTLFAHEFESPVMLIGAAEEGSEPYIRERKDSLSGFINACYALKMRGTNVYIPSRPVGTYEECAEMVNDFSVIARTLSAVKNMKVISFNPRPSSYLASKAPDYLLYDLGIELGEYSELELFNAFKKHEGDARIPKVVSEMQEELGEIKTPEILPSLAQYELTMEDWIRNHKGNKKYAAITSTCWPAFPVNFGFVPCYVNSRLTSKGYPVACEVDVYGAVSEYVGQCVSGDSVSIMNINNNIPLAVYDSKIRGREFCGKKYEIGDLFLAYHCGVTASCKLQSSSLDYHFVNRQLIGEEKSQGTIQGVLKSGDVTIFRIQGTTENKLKAYVAQGQILPVSMETYGGRGIIAIPEFERFIRNVVIEKQFPNHCAVIFGHYGKILFDVLRQLGVDEIYYNHPKHLPYEHENIFDESLID